jgi:hypothetical protein
MAMRRKSKAPKGRARGKSRGKAKAARRAKPARRKAARAKRPDPAAALAAFARKIVKMTSDPNSDFRQIYSPDIVSREASGQESHGYAGIEEKAKNWEQMQEGVTWKARSVCVDGRSGTICIEWDAQVKLRGGPTVPMPEVAIHQVKNGKIVEERYYYNPMALMPPQQGGGAPQP